MSYIYNDTFYHILVNTANRLDPTSSSTNFSYNIDLPEDRYDRVVLKQIFIPASYYLIASTGNQFTLIENGISYNIAIQPANYTGATLATYLTNILSVSDNAYTVTYPSATDPQTGKFTFTYTGTNTATLMFPNSDIGDVLGFIPMITYPFVSNTLQSAIVANLNLQQVHILDSNMVKDGHLAEFLDVNIGGGSVTMTQYDLLGNARMFINKGASYNFTLYNQNGAIVDLNGNDMYFSLLFFRYDDINAHLRSDLLIRLRERM